MLLRLLPTLLAVLVILGNLPRTALAQRFGGRGSSQDHSFRWLDRNGDGNIEDSELERFPPLRTWLEERGLSLTRPVTLQELDDLGRDFREEMTQRRRDRNRDREYDLDDDVPRFGDNSQFDRGQVDDRSRRRGGGPGGFGSFGGGTGRGRDFNNDPNDDDAGSPASPSSSPVAAAQSPTSAPPKLRTPITVKLPDAYKARDVDGDGQIGMYEWPRADLATFRKLDRNHDGFLTPRELLLGAATIASAPPTTTPAAALSTGSTPSSTPAAATATSTPTATTPAPTGVTNSQAQTAFSLLDKDKNGTVSTEEWGRSLTTRPAFEKAGILPQLPITQSEFLILYSRVYPAAK